jgi:hypothetical protein
MLEQAGSGAAGGALLGLLAAYVSGAHGRKFGKMVGIPAAIGALLGGGEAVSPGGRKRSKRYAKEDLDSWKRMQDPVRRKKLIQKMLANNKEWSTY